jgi:serine/threonine-protein kinase
MAPEVIGGRLESGRAWLADVYALGAVAYELLTGAPPFEGRTVSELFDRQVLAPIPDLRERRPDAPPRLAALVAACLAKRAQERPASMEEIAWELHALARAMRRMRAA